MGKAQGPPAPTTFTPPPIGTLVDLGGYRVHVNCTGDGSPTVFIVGAAFSFDWELVQSAVAKFTRVCTFDPSGTTWSDSFQAAVRVLDPNAPPRSTPTCEDRIAEIKRVIAHIKVERPYILVGYSVGALWERLYTAHDPEGVAGMIIVDDAFLPNNKVPEVQKLPGPTSSGLNRGPVLLTKTPIVIGFEDDVNFRKLPQHDQELHEWALAQHPLRPGEEMTADCFSKIDRALGNRSYPLGDMPLTVIRTENETPGYEEMQMKLLSLSRQSREIVAHNSSHMVPIDEPEVIISAIHTMVEHTRGTKTEDSKQH